MNASNQQLDSKNPKTLSQTPFDLIVRRDLQWDFSDVEARFVDHSSMLVSFLWAGFSAGATPIESFFIKTLLPTLETIEGDPKLEQDVQFSTTLQTSCGQSEKIHLRLR